MLPRHNWCPLVENECHQLSQLCNRLLQTAKLEAEELTLLKDEISVSELVDRAVQQQSGHMAGHPIEVALPDTPLKVRGDPEVAFDGASAVSGQCSQILIRCERKVKVSAWDSHSEVTISVQ